MEDIEKLERYKKLESLLEVFYMIYNNIEFEKFDTFLNVYFLLNNLIIKLYSFIVIESR